MFVLLLLIVIYCEIWYKMGAAVKTNQSQAIWNSLLLEIILSQAM